MSQFLTLLYLVVHKTGCLLLTVHNGGAVATQRCLGTTSSISYSLNKYQKSGTSRPRLPGTASTARKRRDMETHRPPRAKTHSAPHPGKRHGRFLRPTMPFFLWPEQNRGRLVPGGETQQAEQVHDAEARLGERKVLFKPKKWNMSPRNSSSATRTLSGNADDKHGYVEHV